MRAVRVVTAAALAASLLAPPVALARAPVLERRAVAASVERGDVLHYPAAMPIDAPASPLAVYGYLARGERVDVYAFTPSRPVDTDVSVLVPTLEGAFRPVVVIESDQGEVVRVGGSGPRARFFEPVTLDLLWQDASERLRLEKGRRYYVKVLPGSGARRGGRYVVALGGADAFAPDGVRTAAVLPRIYLGMYGESPPKAWPCLGIAIVALGGVAALTLARRRSARATPTA